MGDVNIDEAAPARPTAPRRQNLIILKKTTKTEGKM